MGLGRGRGMNEWGERGYGREESLTTPLRLRAQPPTPLVVVEETP